MKSPLRLTLYLTLIATAFVGVLTAFGQDTNVVSGPIDDAAAQQFFARFNRWQLFLVPLVTIVIELLKRGVKIIPRTWLPWISPLAGVLLDYIGSKFGFWTGNVAAGAAFGALAVWFNESIGSTAMDMIRVEENRPPEPKPEK